MVIHCMCEEVEGRILFRADRPRDIGQVFLGLTFAQASAAFRRSLAAEFGGSVRSAGFHKCGPGLRSVSYVIKQGQKEG